MILIVVIFFRSHELIPSSLRYLRSQESETYHVNGQTVRLLPRTTLPEQEDDSQRREALPAAAAAAMSWSSDPAPGQTLLAGSGERGDQSRLFSANRQSSPPSAGAGPKHHHADTMQSTRSVLLDKLEWANRRLSQETSLANTTALVILVREIVQTLEALHSVRF